jgi:hypothetical protein
MAGLALGGDRGGGQRGSRSVDVVDGEGDLMPTWPELLLYAVTGTIVIPIVGIVWVTVFIDMRARIRKARKDL